MAKAEIPIPKEAGETAKPKSKKSLIIIIAVLVIGGGGGAGWFFTRDSKHAAEVKVAEHVEPKFIMLEPFTVNLQQEGGEKFLQIGITLKLTDLALEEKIKLHMPEIRSHLLLLLSGKHATEIMPAEGKKMLAYEITAEVSTILGLPLPPAPKPAPSEEDISAMPDAQDKETGVASAPEAAPAEPAPQAASSPAAEHGGASVAPLDVLFTSFIIQ